MSKIRMLILALVPAMLVTMAACGTVEPDIESSGEQTTAGSGDNTEPVQSGDETTEDTNDSSEDTTDPDDDSATQNGSGNTSGKTNNKTGTTKTGTGTTKPGKFTPRSDWKGEKVVVMREWAPYESGKNTAHDNWNKRIADLEKKYNVDIVEEKWNATLMQESLSGQKPAGNLYQVSAGVVWSLAKEGYIGDFNAAMAATGIDMTSDVYHPFNVQVSHLNGKQYAIGIEEAKLNTGILFNNKLISEVGYDVYKLVSEKKWNWSIVTEIAKKVKAKHPDKYGIGMNKSVVQAMAIGNGSSLITTDSKGNLMSNFSSAAVRQSLEQIYNWCNVDKVAIYNWGNLAWNALDAEFANGNIAIYFCQESSLSKASATLGENDYGFTYLPMGPKATSYRADMIPAYPWVVPKAYQDKAADYLWLVDQMYQLKPGYTKDNQFRDLWIRKFKSAKAYNAYKDMNRNVTFGFNPPVNLTSESAPWTNTVAKLFQGTMAPGVIIDTYANTYAKALEDEWKGIRYTGTYKR